MDTSLYEKIKEDPTKTLHKTLVDLWIEGKTNGIVSPAAAKDIMGISENEKANGSGPTNAQSTLPHFKPGNPYFYPVLKIQK